MIQISSPTQPLSSPAESAAPPGNGSAEGVSGGWEHKAQKKNRSGFFAKLLDGLIAKNGSKNGPEAAERTAGKAKTENSGADGTAAAGNLAEIFSKFDGAGKISLKTAQNLEGVTGEPAPGEEFFGAEEVSAAVLARPRNDAAETEPLLDGEPRSVRKSAGNAVFGNAAGVEDSRIQSVAGDPAFKSAEGNELEPPELSGGEKPKDGGRGAAAFQRRVFDTGPDGAVRGAEIQYAAGFQLDGERAGVRPEPADGEREAEGGPVRAKKGRLNVEYRDLRTGEIKEAGTSETVKSPVFDAALPESVETEILVDLKLPEGREAGWKAPGEAPPARSFEDALAGQLRGNLSADIVQNATIIARNGGEGTIRLALHPASLGDVKIRIEMTENKITGLIIVESEEALRAFERELPVLEKAFRDSGFSETNLEMSLAQDGWNSGGREGRREGDFSALAPVMAASRYEAESDRVEFFDAAAALPDGSILSASPGRTPVNLLI